MEHIVNFLGSWKVHFVSNITNALDDLERVKESSTEFVVTLATNGKLAIRTQSNVYPIARGKRDVTTIFVCQKLHSVMGDFEIVL